jgi:hypothetical protein
VHTTNGEKFNVAAPSEVEHGDRVIDPHVGVKQDLAAFHKGESVRPYRENCVLGAESTSCCVYCEQLLRR